MSGVAKTVKKVFKKAVKVAKKVAPMVLVAGAVYFTAAGALAGSGIGGWGAAVSKSVANMGGTGLLGNVLAGAVTQAGHGAIAGGISSMVAGGDFMDGATSGAMAGAVGGGIAGGLGYGTSALPSELGKNVGVDPYNIGAGGEFAGGADGVISGGSGSDWLVGSAGTDTLSAAAPSNTGGSDLFDKAVDFLKSEGGGDFAGKVIGGLGSGLMAGSAAEAEAKAIERKAELAHQTEMDKINAVRANYGSGGGGLLSSDQQAQVQAQRGTRGFQSPTQRFDPITFGNGGWRYNPGTGRIEAA